MVGLLGINSSFFVCGPHSDFIILRVHGNKLRESKRDLGATHCCRENLVRRRLQISCKQPRTSTVSFLFCNWYSFAAWSSTLIIHTAHKESQICRVSSTYKERSKAPFAFSNSLLDRSSRKSSPKNTHIDISK